MLNKWAPGRSHFWPQGYNLNNLGRSPLDEVTYQRPGPSGLVKKIFKGFPYVSLCKTCCPLSRAIFGPRATIRTILVEVH